MKLSKISGTLMLLLFSFIFSANAQDKKTVYIFGVSDSMSDSIVYITGIQRIDRANVQKHTDYLLDRADYSQQLKDYFSQRLNDHKRICIIYVCKDEKAASKKLLKVRRNYLDEGAVVKQLEANDFAFLPIEGVTDNSEEVRKTLSNTQ